MSSEYALVTSEKKLNQNINKAMEHQLTILTSTRDEERAQFEEALEVERLKTYLEQNETEDQQAGFLSWSEANELAEYLYEDSNGRFEKDWGRFLALESIKKDMDPFLVYELLRVETGGTFSPTAVGPQTRYGRAYGIAQFMRNTSPWIAEMAGLPYNHDMLFDPLYSIELAITYLDFLYKQYGDWDHALTAYHRGIGGLQNYIARNGHAKSWYAVEIQENAKESQLVAVNH
ncbi:lytic transglycosylase domain-containing protein [Bacillus tamaricis]|uniref:Lytic transglycosylase domain-containing protein n=2 Tax=Evansella tamaricis TaxID=2069301 RepID=A0ABS6JJ34_9BACI|nr:lytic transglycosylase domain-containing protein [Evansella tamaricis]